MTQQLSFYVENDTTSVIFLIVGYLKILTSIDHPNSLWLKICAHLNTTTKLTTVFTNMPCPRKLRKGEGFIVAELNSWVSNCFWVVRDVTCIKAKLESDNAIIMKSSATHASALAFRLDVQWTVYSEPVWTSELKGGILLLVTRLFTWLYLIGLS